VAIRDAGAFLVERGAPGNDPAEEVALIGAGYESVLGAGGRGQAGGWLVEIYADSISLPLHGLEGVTRVLVALALAGGTVAVPR
jgi:hypothetical protein